MKFIEQNIPGVYLIEMEPFKDERGSFARQFCLKELQHNGLEFSMCQCNLSGNTHKGTLRGLHYQKDPFPEIKIVSCLRGRIFDVVVDLRPTSPTYLKHITTELTEDNNKLLYIPPMCAHGFQTLENNSIVYYQLGEFFHPEAYAGVRWNDPKLGINWPIKNPIINERDNNYALL